MTYVYAMMTHTHTEASVAVSTSSLPSGITSMVRWYPLFVEFLSQEKIALRRNWIGSGRTVSLVSNAESEHIYPHLIEFSYSRSITSKALVLAGVSLMGICLLCSSWLRVIKWPVTSTFMLHHLSILLHPFLCSFVILFVNNSIFFSKSKIHYKTYLQLNHLFFHHVCCCFLPVMLQIHGG